MNERSESSTLRLNFPLWHGGNRPEYHFGAQLLAWLAPTAVGPVETVTIPEPGPGESLDVEEGISGRTVLLRHLREARQAIEKHRPSRILTLGGDCLVDLPPTCYARNAAAITVDVRLNVVKSRSLSVLR
jgi:arginase